MVLGQDQTLKLKCCYQHNLDVRTSAHTVSHHGVMGSVSVCCISIKRYRKPTNSEADTGHRYQTIRPNPYQRRSMCVGLPSKRTKPPTYLFSVFNCQKAPHPEEHEETKSTDSAIFLLAQPASSTSELSTSLTPSSSPSARLASRCAPQRRR